METLLSSCARRCASLAILLALLPDPAQAQLGPLRTPTISLPQTLGTVDQDLLRRPGARLLNLRELDGPVKLIEQRLATVTSLLQRYPAYLETDRTGALVVKHEIMAWSPSKAGLAHAEALGLTILRQSKAGDAGSWVVFDVPQHLDTAVVLTQLQGRDPQGEYDFNHVYTGSGLAMGKDLAPQGGTVPGGKAGARAAIAAGAVGLIDSGVDADHPVFSATHLKRWGCDGTSHPAHHGTAVAALMVGQSDHFRGVAPHSDLYAADVYCDSPTGGSVDKIVQALNWQAAQGVAVINLSLVGPPNRMLERAVAVMIARGHILVAAAGNDGPAAAPLYPAAYPGVVAVSAVDPQGKPLPESPRGPFILFYAPGSKIVSATTGSPPYRQVRGSSFASPVVAAMLAQGMQQPDVVKARQVIASMTQRAVKADNETDPRIVGREYRNDPTAFR